MQTAMEIVSCLSRMDSAGNVVEPSVPVNAIQVHVQDAQGQHMSFLIRNAEEVAAIRAVWEPYKAEVATAIKSQEETGEPVSWPAAPRVSVVVELVS